MNGILIYSDPMDLAHKATEWLERKKIQYRGRSTYVPAGKSPEPLYQYWNEKRPDVLMDLKLVQVDDVCTGESNGCFQKYFESHLPSFKKQFHWVTDHEVQADLAILGLGRNGHVGFHEPHVSEKFFMGEVSLSEVTKADLGIVGSAFGRTYGLGAFLATKAILLLVSGLHKKKIFQEMMNNNDHLPVTRLRSHPDLTILVQSQLLEG